MKQEKWYFTFGIGQDNRSHYVMFTGTFNEARYKMINLYGLKWSIQYSESEFVGHPEKYNLTRLIQP